MTYDRTPETVAERDRLKVVNAMLLEALESLADLCEERGLYPLNVDDARAAIRAAKDQGEAGKDTGNDKLCRLHAAAPMLLEELQDAETIIEQALAYAEAMQEHGWGTTFIDTHGRLGDSVLAGIRAVIRQAKGESV